MKEKKYLYEWCIENNRQDLLDSLLNAGVSIETLKTTPYASKKIILPFFCQDCKNKYDELIKTNPKLPKFYIQEYEVQKKTIQNNKCRICSCRGKNGVVSGVNDLETFCLQNKEFKYLLDEWDYDKNIKPDFPSSPSLIASNYTKDVNWKCKNGHQWTASPNSRINTGNGCKQCSDERRKSKAEKTVFYYIKQVFPNAFDNYKIPKTSGLELDIYIKELSLGIEYDGFWHNRNLKKDIKKYEICKENNIKLVRIREKQCQQIENIADICYYLKQENNKDLNNAVRFLFDCIKTLTNKTFEIPDINWKRDIHKAEELIDLSIKENSVANYPLLKEQWHPTKNGNITPDRVPAQSNIPRYWRCKKCGYGLPEGQNWIVSPNARIENNKVNGCPSCAGIELNKGYNDFETRCNDEEYQKEYKRKYNKDLKLLLEEWNEEFNSKIIAKNGNPLTKDNITFGSGDEVHWICSNPKCRYGSKKDKWITPLKRRTISGIGCPVCGGKIVSEGINDINTTHPEIAAQWDDEKNLKEFNRTKYNTSHGYNKPVWWICEKGHHYKATPNDRTGNKHICCSICSNRELLVGYNDLETYCKNIENQKKYKEKFNKELLSTLDEWHEDNKITPKDIRYSDNKEQILWKCPICNSKYSLTAKRKLQREGIGCNNCVQKRKNANLREKLTKGKELSIVNPELAKEWHPDPEKNFDSKKNIYRTPDNTSANNNYKAYWKCSKCGHEWLAQVKARNKGSGCPECYKNKRKNNKLK